MAITCNSTRCTRCGKKKRPTHGDIVSMRDSELMDLEMVDTLWSPLDSSKGRCVVQQVPSYSPSPVARTIKLDLVTRDRERDHSLASIRRRKHAGQQTSRNRIMIRGRRLSATQIMHNFAHGMASAFGASITSRPRPAGRKAYLTDFELGNLTASRSFLPAILPSGSRIRYLFSRMAGTPKAMSSEQFPLAADDDEDLTSYSSAMPTSYRLRAY